MSKTKTEKVKAEKIKPIKICPDCGIRKLEYRKFYCLECAKERRRLSVLKWRTSEKAKATQAAYNRTEKRRVARAKLQNTEEYKEYQKKYRETHKEYQREYQKRKYREAKEQNKFKVK